MALDPKVNLRGPARDAWLDYVRYHREKAHSPRTILHAGETAAQLQAWLDGARPGTGLLDAGRHDISDYLESLAARGLSAGTVHNRHAMLRAFYRFCADEEIITASPMLRVQAPSPRHAVPEVVCDADLTALLAACRAPAKAGPWAKLCALRDEAVIRIFCEPGSPRCSEMAALTTADADLDTDQVVIAHGKGNKRRVIGMSAATARAVSRYKRARAADRRAAGTDRLWLGYSGPLTRFGVGELLTRRSDQAGIARVRPHQLRHTAFADFDQATGGHTNAAMALFGWERPDMAHHYGKALRAASALRTARDLQRGNRFGKAAG